MTILQEIIEFKHGQNPLKNRYVQYIKDTTISLNERWTVFIQAPTDWKEHRSWIQHFNVEKKLKYEEISWYDDFYIERHQTVHMETIIERIEDMVKEGESSWNQEMIVQFKEEILSQNLGSFDYDW